MATKRIGILAAMPQEIAKLKETVQGQADFQKGSVFTFTTGTLEGKPVVFAAANIGTVFAGSAATTMINEFGATKIVFTGVAGGLLEGQKIGDIVVGSRVVNYEMDARSFTAPWEPDYKYSLGEIPIMKWRYYDADPAMLAIATAAPVAEGVTVATGLIASGSVFITSEAKQAMRATVWEPLGMPAACEMENAGVAQICRAYDVPYVSLRALSDLITGDANADFGAFCDQAANNVYPIVAHLVREMEV